MVFAVNPVMLLVKLPEPVPFVVWLLLVVGLWLVLQHMPRAVTVAEPRFVTLPPPVAVVCGMLVTWLVVTVGLVTFWEVVNLTSEP